MVAEFLSSNLDFSIWHENVFVWLFGTNFSYQPGIIVSDGYWTGCGRDAKWRWNPKRQFSQAVLYKRIPYFQETVVGEIWMYIYIYISLIIYIYINIGFCSPGVISFLGLILVWRIEELSPTLLLPVYSASFACWSVPTNIYIVYHVGKHIVNGIWFSQEEDDNLIMSVDDDFVNQEVMRSLERFRRWWQLQDLPQKRLGWFIQQEHKVLQGNLDLHPQTLQLYRDDPYLCMLLILLSPGVPGKAGVCCTSPSQHIAIYCWTQICFTTGFRFPPIKSLGG